MKTGLNPKNLWPGRLSPALAALILALGLFIGLVADLLARGRLFQLDSQVFGLMAGLQSPTLSGLMTYLTWPGGRLGIALAVAVMALYLCYKRKWPDLLILFIIYAGGELVLFLLKAIYHRPRPLGHPGYGFPSGHAFAITAIYGFLIYSAWQSSLHRKAQYLLAALALLLMLGVGASRVYLQVHWLADVLAGYLAGFAWLILSILAVKAILPRKVVSNQ